MRKLFASKQEAENAFKELMSGLIREASREPDDTMPFCLNAKWILEKGLEPLVLHVQRYSHGATQIIELRSGIYDLVVGSQEGKWRYYYKEAMSAHSDPALFGSDFTIFETMAELEEALLQDINMYLDGSYKTSSVRPRSRVKA